MGLEEKNYFHYLDRFTANSFKHLSSLIIVNKYVWGVAEKREMEIESLCIYNLI